MRCHPVREAQPAPAPPVAPSCKPCLDFLRPGDTLMVTRIDRLARSIGDLQDIVRAVKAKGAALKATEQPIDTGTAAGKAFLECWACSPSSRPTCVRSASWKASPRRRKPESTRGGRPPSTSTLVRQLKADGLGPSKIAKALGIGRASVYRTLAKA